MTTTPTQIPCDDVCPSAPKRPSYRMVDGNYGSARRELFPMDPALTPIPVGNGQEFSASYSLLPTQVLDPALQPYGTIYRRV